jgi:hypothetical protein
MEGFTSLSEERDRLQERSLQRQVAADAAAKHQQHTASARAAREKRESEALVGDLQATNARLRKRIKSLKQSLRSSAATAKKLGALQRERTPFELCACGNPGAQGAEGGDVPSCPQAERQPLRPPPQSKELPFLRSRVEALEVGVQDDHSCCLAPNVGQCSRASGGVSASVSGLLYKRNDDVPLQRNRDRCATTFAATWHHV